nr:methylated-DNA--[protein]-cysteine S-methyltransferase [Rhabdothermincola salaria]
MRRIEFGAWPPPPDDEVSARATAVLEQACSELDEYFAGSRTSFDVAIDWARATSGFRSRVLHELALVPFGEVVSYAELAGRAGNPNAARAVGSAMATNPWPIVVPCHRVVRSGGALGQYGGGPDVKARLLALEGLTLPA